MKKMSTQLLTLALVVFCAFMLTACPQAEEAADDAGDMMEKAAEEVEEGVDAMADEAEEGMEAMGEMAEDGMDAAEDALEAVDEKMEGEGDDDDH